MSNNQGQVYYTMSEYFVVIKNNSYIEEHIYSFNIQLLNVLEEHSL